MDVCGFTIDGPTTRDIDDAIWVDTTMRGWTVTVCVANVAAAIALNSTFDQTAYRRVNTIYLAGDRNKPMIPRRFSEGSCSLFPGEQRSVMAIRIHLDHALEPQGLPIIGEAKLTSLRQLAYAEVPGIVMDARDGLHHPIRNAEKLAHGLMQKRRMNGAFVLYDLANGWIMSESGHIRKLKDSKETVGNIIIQELMILANAQVARYCLEKGIPIPYRNHTSRISAPPRERMMELIEQGLRGPVSSFERARGSFMMVMNRAVYNAKLEGHYGLNLPAYTHSTSPIRRYADLIVQRQLLAHIRRSELPYTIDDIEEMCAHINTVVASQSEEKSEAAIERANKKAARQSEGNLENLPDKEFSRVLKVAARGKYLQHVDAEFRRRIESGASSLIDEHFILLESDGEEWNQSRRLILEKLFESPHKATSLATLAHQNSGWSEPKFIMRQGGEDNSLVHYASAEFKSPKLKTPDVVGSSKKLARQRAAVTAFHLHLGQPPPSWVSAPSPAGAVALPDASTANPIGALNEYCQKLGEKLPEYTADHYSNETTMFVVSCRVLNLHVKSSGQPSKKAAKKEAAQRALQLIIERS